MQPGGILAVLNDLDATCDRGAYETWYQLDHMPDRLAIPGFRHARRYRGIAGQAQQEFFTFYETESPAVLRSEAYLARLAAPTDGTIAMMRHFRAMCRSICAVAVDAGGGIGGVAAVVGAPTATAACPDLAPLLAPGSVSRIRLWTEAEDIASNPEAALRPGADTRLGTILVVEGTDAAPVRAAAISAAAMLGLPTAVGLYTLLYASSGAGQS
jgi:hypothetical protein